MPQSNIEYRLKRREFISSALAVSGMAAGASLFSPSCALAVTPKLASLDPVNPNIYFGTTGSYFASWAGVTGIAAKMSDNMPMMLADVKHYGLQGFEPYSGQVVQFLDDPMALKKMADTAGVVVECIGDLARKPNPGARRGGGAGAAAGGGRGAASGGAPAVYPWLGDEGNAELITNMVSFARDFLKPMGINHWKTNMGSRPPGGPSDAQLMGLANTLNEIGKQTIAYGVRLSPHPHMWGPMEREHDFRTVMDNTDPKYVWLTLDTGHNVLGGMDPVKIVSDYFPRLSELHLKDTYAQYIGNTVELTQKQHRQKSLYSVSLGSGGVDFPGIFRILRDRHFKGWAVFDIDAPRPEDIMTTDEAFAKSIDYMRTALHIKFPPPPATGLFTEG